MRRVTALLLTLILVAAFAVPAPPDISAHRSKPTPVPTATPGLPDTVGTVYIGGAETRSLAYGGMDGISGGAAAVTIDTTTFRPPGSASWKVNSGAGNTTSYANITNAASFALGVTVYARVYMYFVDYPASTVNVLELGGSNQTAVKMTSTGALQLFAAGSQVGSDSTPLNKNQWYRIEVAQMFQTGAADYSELRIDGVSLASTTTASLSDSVGSFQLLVGWRAAPGANKVLYFDDVVVNDSTGAANNSWPGEGHVVLLVPISDNARATLWTGGAGGTTSLFDAVNNKPPIGTDTETDLTQIEHAGGAAGTTDAYDANMTSYTAAGVGANDPILAVAPFIVHGEDIVTGTKLLTFSVVSNPAIAAPTNFSAGDDAGALLVYPTGWKLRVGTLSERPSVTLGTSPVMRVTRPETASRVASVCFMGMYVSYQDVILHDFMHMLQAQPLLVG